MQKKTQIHTSTQKSLITEEPDILEGFKRLYYHLYTNSNSSRAERIISDLSKLLLIKACMSNENESEINEFLHGNSSANQVLFPILKSQFPDSLDDQDRFSLDDNALRYGLSAISNLDLKEAPAHILGDAFQALMGPRLRGDKGQFFTPKTLVRAMVEIVDPRSDSVVIDPACGTGGFLIETIQFWKSKNSKKSGTVIGIDKDKDLSLLGSALLSLVAGHKSTVFNANSLDIESDELTSTKRWLGKVDYVLTNPPFGSKISVTDSEILKSYKFGYSWRFDDRLNQWVKTDQLLTSQDPQILFLELCVNLLKPGGKMGIVLPEGVFGNKGVGFVWDYLRGHGHIFGLLDCPRTTFQPGTDTKTNVLFFEKSPLTKQKPIDRLTSVAVAINCGHDRRGRLFNSKGERYSDDFATISTEFNSKSSQFWTSCKLSNPYYLVPRYYDSLSQKLLAADAEKYDAEIVTLREMKERGWITIKKGDEVGADAYGTGDYPFVRTSDIANFEISADPTKSVSQETYDQYAAAQNLSPGDILMVVDGRYRIGRCAILHESNYQCIAQSHLRIFTISPSAPFKSVELLLLLSLPSVQKEMRGLVFIQSTLGSIAGRLEELKLPLPKSSKAWKAQVKVFSDLINKRAETLAELQQFEASIPEL